MNSNKGGQRCPMNGLTEPQSRRKLRFVHKFPCLSVLGGGSASRGQPLQKMQALTREQELTEGRASKKVRGNLL